MKHLLKKSKKLFHKVANKISGRTKIKKQAAAQQAQQRANINAAKQTTLATLSAQYQQCLEEINNSKAIIANTLTATIAEKNAVVSAINAAKLAACSNNNLATEELNNVVRILEQQAGETLAQFIEVIQELEHDLLQIDQLESNVAADQEEAPRVLAELTQQLQTKIDSAVTAIEEQYNHLAEQQQNELNFNEAEEHRIAAEYAEEQNAINYRYNAHLNSVLQNIESWKKQASKRATKHFAINIASNIAANLIAPGISGAIGVTSKLGNAVVQSVSCTAINSIATQNVKHLPKSFLKSAVTAGVTSLVQSGLEELLNPSNATESVATVENNVVNGNPPVNQITPAGSVSSNNSSHSSTQSINSSISDNINYEPVTVRPETIRKFEPSPAMFSNHLTVEGVNTGTRVLSRTNSKTFCGYKGKRFKTGITPYTNNRVELSNSGIVNQGTVGINLAEVNFNKVNMSVDLLRLDTQIANELITDVTGASGSVRSSLDIAAAAGVVTTQVGPFKLPGTSLQCHATAKTALLGFKHHCEKSLNRPLQCVTAVKPIDFMVSAVCSPIEKSPQLTIAGP